MCGFLSPEGFPCNFPAPSKIPGSCVRFQVQVWTCSALFSISSFQFAAGQTLVPLPCSSQDSGFQLPVSDSGLDLLRSLLAFWFRVSCQTLVRLPSCSLDAAFLFPVPAFRFWVSTASHAPRFWFLVSGRALVRLTGGSVVLQMF